MTIFVISDTHFGHANILTFKNLDFSHICNHGILGWECGLCADEGVVVPKKLIRPGFSSVEEMDEHMVERWNAVVKPSDHVYHLGDVAMKRPDLKIVKRLNGHKRLVFGNHDIYDHKNYTEVGFEKVMGSRVLEGWLMTHIPVHPESLGRFRGNVHGHIHERPSPSGSYINVSVERINYTPLALEELRLTGV